MKRKTFLILLTTITTIGLSLIFIPRIISLFEEPDEVETVVGYSTGTEFAIVTNILEEGEMTLGEVLQPYQTLSVTVLEGQFAGKSFEVEHGTRQIRSDLIMLEVGDKILVTISSLPDGTTSAHFTDFYRKNSLIVLFLLFILLSVLISGWKGLRSLLGILLSLGIIVLIILPGIQEGRDPLSVSILGAFFFVGLSLYVVYGWTVKTHTAVLGSFLALTITGVLSYFFINHAKLTGYGDENMFFISQITQNTLNIRSLLLASVIIGTMGVLDDLVISQASAVFELYKSKPDQSIRELFKAAMNIGKDHIAATVNTLVLTYAGASLPMLLLFSIRNVDFSLAINLEYIAEEIVRMLVGSLGLFISVPITTAIAALFAVKYRNFGKFQNYLGPLNS